MTVDISINRHASVYTNCRIRRFINVFLKRRAMQLLIMKLVILGTNQVQIGRIVKIIMKSTNLDLFDFMK